MNKNVIIVTSKKEKNQVVTNMYLQTIALACQRAGFNIIDRSRLNLINKKQDFLIFDECVTAFKYWIKGYKNLIIWLQGIEPEESVILGYHDNKYYYYIFSWIEKYMLKKSKFLFFVSNRMKEHYERKYKLDIKNNSFIMPCFNVNQINKKSFLNENKYKNNTFLYAGSMAKYQSFDKIAKLYSEIEKQVNNTHFFIFTSEQKKALQIINKYNIKNYTLDYASVHDLNKKIQNIKYGFLLREDNIVNEVATPTKLSTYVANGIIPIYSPCLTSFDEYNKQGGLALDFDLKNWKSDEHKIIAKIQMQVKSDEVYKWCKNTFMTYYNQKKYIFLAGKKLKKSLF